MNFPVIYGSESYVSSLILNTYSCSFKNDRNGHCGVNNDGGTVNSRRLRVKLFILLV